MDGSRFDRLIRELATTHNRRVLLSALAGGLGVLAPAAWGGRVSAQDACPETCAEGLSCRNGGCMRLCENHRDCRSKHDDPCILNQCLDGVCVEAIVDCLPGYECCEGGCCAKGCATDADCYVLDPCLWGRCGAEGTCEFSQLDPCIICASDAECQDGVNTICCGGACQRPCPEGTVMGKGCECRADGSATLNGPVVRDDASGSEASGGRQDPLRRGLGRYMGGQ